MINFPIDLVLPYVNCTDKVWQKTYQNFCRTHGYKKKLAEFSNERYRDWGYLRYLFRGIDQNMQFLHKIFILLQSESQIPDWLKKESVEIVYHDQFIPAEFLPTYNSTTIEMFLDRIPGLSEHFIYANDDIYAMTPLTAEDFYTEDGKIKMGFRRRILTAPLLQFDVVCNSGFNMVQRKLLHKDTAPEYLTPYHELMPMIKSDVAEVNRLFAEDIKRGITPFREPCNHNQYIYSYYQLFRNNTVQPERTYAYTNMENNVKQVCDVLMNGTTNILVLNDSEKTNVAAWVNNPQMAIALEMRWPRVSRFEKRPRVSVCIPMYNSEEFIERCLASIPCREDVEILIIDDASADRSIEIASEFLKNHPRYQILGMRENAPVGLLRNILIDKSTGEYIFFLDSDDWLITDAFVNVLDNKLTDQNILMPKYIRNDEFSGYPNILRGGFLKREYVEPVKHDPTKRCFEDVDFKKRLTQYHGGTLDEIKEDTIVYHYDLPRKGSITWEYWKERGVNGYQRGASEWERWYKNKPR